MLSGETVAPSARTQCPESGTNRGGSQGRVAVWRRAAGRGRRRASTDDAVGVISRRANGCYHAREHTCRALDADRIDPDLPALRPSLDRADADRRLPVLVRLQGLRREAQAIAGRLLRVLFLRLGAVPASAACCAPARARCARVAESHVAGLRPRIESWMAPAESIRRCGPFIARWQADRRDGRRPYRCRRAWSRGRD